MLTKQIAKLQTSELAPGSGYKKGFHMQVTGISGLMGFWFKWAVMGSEFPLKPLKKGTFNS